MRAPLDQMVIRNPVMDASYTEPGTNQGHVHGALGGTRGTDVRGHGHHHQGWDLYAPLSTPAFAIASGSIARAENDPKNSTKLGRYVTLRFEATDPFDHGKKTFYALYAHLQSISVHPGKIHEAAVVGRTGISGNAKGGPPHLHFAILRKEVPTKGMTDNVDPGHFLGFHHVNFDLLFPNWNRA